MTLFISILLTAPTGILNEESTHTQEPHHTSILTGEGWVMELLEGHPNHIQCELGVSCDVFLELIDELQWFRHRNSKYVSLVEQLAIFLYMSVHAWGLQLDMLENGFSGPMRLYQSE